MKRGFEKSPGQRIRIMQLVISLGIAFAVFGNVHAKEVYTWTDENGTPHYSDMPPVNTTAEAMEVEGAYKPGTEDSAPDDPPPVDSDPDTPELSAAEQRREKMAKDRAERNAKKAEIEKGCAKYTRLLADVEPYRRVLYTNEQGDTVRLDDDQRMALVNESKDYISKNCK